MNYIKTILLALVGRYAKAHKKDIKKAQKWIDSAQAGFASAIEEAEISSNKFDEIIEDAISKINELQEIIEDAKSRKSQAVSFKEKVENLVN